MAKEVKNMKRNAKLLTSVLSIAFLLCACNEEPSTTTTTSTTDTSTTSTTTSDTPGPVPEEIHKISKTIGAHIMYSGQELSKVNIYNFEGKGDVPYVRIERLLAALFKELFDQTLSFITTDLGDGVYNITLKKYEEYESITIDIVNDKIKIDKDDMGLFDSLGTTSKGKRYFVTGQYTNYIKFDNARSKTFVEKTYHTFDLKKYDLDLVCDEDDLIFMPFGVANNIFLAPMGYNLIFNGKDLYFTDYAPYESTYTTSPYLNKTTRSTEFAKYTYNEFVFFVENTYGLRERRGFVGNFDKILSDAGYKNALLSTNTATYEEAMARVTAKIFYDGHSGYISPSLFVNSNKDTYSSLYQSVLQNENEREIQLMSVYNDLIKKRSTAHKSIGCEIDGDLAIIRFDGFNMSHYNIQNYDVDDYSYNQLHSDSILLFKKAFLDISRNANVKNVVVDISTNGGGAADTLPWLVANFTLHPTLTLMHDQTGECFETAYSVDLNFDGKYDEDDTHAGQYNFYLLTSGFSFSCGNYFPTVIKEKGLMTLIGHKSGGGECSVGSYSTASTTILRNSSTYHLGVYDNDEKKFIGNDNGIEVDYELDYADYYNNTAIKALIADIQNP